MKSMWTALLVAGLVTVAGSVYAGSACCASKAKEKATASVCAKATAGMDLTEEQKTKVAAIEAKCQEGGCSKESCDKAKGEIREILTDDQKSTFDAAWEKSCSVKSESCSK